MTGRQFWRKFDRGMTRFNRAFDRSLNRAVRPRPHISRGPSVFDMLIDGLTGAPRRRRR